MVICSTCQSQYTVDELTKIRDLFICDPCMMNFKSQQTSIKYVNGSNVNYYNFHPVLGITKDDQEITKKLPHLSISGDNLIVDGSLHHLEKDMTIKFFGMNDVEKKLIGLVRSILSGKIKLSYPFLAITKPTVSSDPSLVVNLYCDHRHKDGLSKEIKMLIKNSIIK